MPKSIPFFQKPGWYAFAPDGEYRHVFPPGGHTGPPLRRDTEVAWDIYKGKGLAVRWCEIFVGNGLGHSAWQAVSLSKASRFLQILPFVRMGGPMCPLIVDTLNWLHVGNKGNMSENVPFFQKLGWYAFAPDGGHRHVFLLGGHMGPPPTARYRGSVRYLQGKRPCNEVVRDVCGERLGPFAGEKIGEFVARWGRYEFALLV